MTPEDQVSDATTAAPNFTATLALPLQSASPITSPEPTAIGNAGDATLTALHDELGYTLTVGQALEKISDARRKVPSSRSMQRYCIEGRVAAQKIRTGLGLPILESGQGSAKNQVD